MVSSESEFLRRPAEPWNFAAPSLDTRALVEAMLATMFERRWMGLAAPQVGLSLRVFVADLGDGNPRGFFNPEIVSRSEATETFYECCLSFPGVCRPVRRNLSVAIAYRDVDGVRREEVYEGWNACCVQHEIDHLAGICFDEPVDPEFLANAFGEREEGP